MVCVYYTITTPLIAVESVAIVAAAGEGVLSVHTDVVTTTIICRTLIDRTNIYHQKRRQKMIYTLYKHSGYSLVYRKASHAYLGQICLSCSHFLCSQRCMNNRQDYCTSVEDTVRRLALHKLCIYNIHPATLSLLKLLLCTYRCM